MLTFDVVVDLGDDGFVLDPHRLNRVGFAFGCCGLPMLFPNAHFLQVLDLLLAGFGHPLFEHNFLAFVLVFDVCGGLHLDCAFLLVVLLESLDLFVELLKSFALFANFWVFFWLGAFFLHREGR